MSVSKSISSTASSIKKCVMPTNCAISKLFVVLATLSVITICLLPEDFYVLSDNRNGTVKQLHITPMKKVLMVVMYFVGTSIVNKYLKKYCKSGSSNKAVITFLLGQVLIAVAVSLVLLSTGETRYLSEGYQVARGRVVKRN